MKLIFNSTVTAVWLFGNIACNDDTVGAGTVDTQVVDSDSQDSLCKNDAIDCSGEDTALENGDMACDPENTELGSDSCTYGCIDGVNTTEAFVLDRDDCNYYPWDDGDVPEQLYPCTCDSGNAGTVSWTNNDSVCRCDGDTVSIEAWYKALLANVWYGTVETPFGESGTVYVSLVTSEKTNPYIAKRLDTCAPGFYYGVIGEAAGQTWEFLGLNSDGSGHGELQLVFGPDDVRTAELRNIYIDPAAEADLTFELWLDGEGPFLYTLRATHVEC